MHVSLHNPEDAIAQKSGSEFIVRRAGAAAYASETSAKKGGGEGEERELPTLS